MLRNYLKIALRNLLRDRLTSFINIVGLAVGFTSCLLIGLYVDRQLAYDRHHTDYDHIVRVAAERNYANGEQKRYATSPLPLADLLVRNLPEVKQTARVFSPQWTNQKSLVNYQDKSFYESDLVFADSTFFQVFSGYSFVEGNPVKALSRPNAVVLTEAMARKYFGNENPIGQKLKIDQELEAEVTGVLRNPVQPTHLQTDFIASFNLLNEQYGDLLSLWGWDLAYTYAVLDRQANPAAVAAKVPGLVSTHLPGFKAQRGYAYNFVLQPLADIHLYSDRQWEIQPNGRAIYVYTLLAVAGLILLISCFNAINLQLARMTTRATEVGIRKTLGASWWQLPTQFMAEAALLTALSFTLAAMLTVAALPWLEQFSGQLSSLLVNQKEMLLIGILTVVIVLVGLVPTRYLAGIKLITVLKKGNTPKDSLAWLRKGLIISQFAASVFLLIACLGLFGLATFAARQRTREIGIRKVLGASVPSLVSMLSRDFLKLVLIAILIVSPVAWYTVNRWLQDFAYHIDVPGWAFVLAGLSAILVALLTVSVQAIRAALANPVESLRTE